MKIVCPDCGFSATIAPAKVPANGTTAGCPKCSCRFHVEPPRPAVAEPAAGQPVICPSCRQEQPFAAECSRCGVIFARYRPPQVAAPAAAAAALPEDLPDEGPVSVINIIALLCLLDAILSLISRVPGLAAVLGGGTGRTFYQQARYLYDTLMAAGFFIAAFGLSARRNWARVALLWLFGLGLVEGLSMLLYQYFVIAGLEANLQEGFPELKRQQSSKLIGCALYAFFLCKLTSRKIRARFRS